MLTTDGVAIADTGMRRIQAVDFDSAQIGRLGVLVPKRPCLCWNRASAAKDSRPCLAIASKVGALIPKRPSFSANPHSAIRNPQFRVNVRSALTLIELLAVIAITGVLAAITFGIARGVQQRSGIGRARVEMAAIAQALEVYRTKYGDYPQTSSAATMLQCIIGRRGPTGTALTEMPLIEMARFSTIDDTDPFTSTAAILMDPFGKGYHYAYKTGGSWRNPSFMLYSGGPDGTVEGTLPADGYLTPAFETAINTASRTGNPDNIYHGRD
jgi:prepilin-type N-terminal cleavage/methylation domain-containing protein